MRSGPTTAVMCLLACIVHVVQCQSPLSWVWPLFACAGADLLWGSAQLAAAVVPAITSNVESLDHNLMRLLVRHVAITYCARCPPQHQVSAYVLPCCGFCHACLATAWLARSRRLKLISLPYSTLCAGVTKHLTNPSSMLCGDLTCAAHVVAAHLPCAAATPCCEAQRRLGCAVCSGTGGTRRASWSGGSRGRARAQRGWLETVRQ